MTCWATTALADSDWLESGHRFRVLMTDHRAGIRQCVSYQLCGIAAANEHRQVLLAIMLIGEWQTRLTSGRSSSKSISPVVLSTAKIGWPRLRPAFADKQQCFGE